MMPYYLSRYSFIEQNVSSIYSNKRILRNPKKVLAHFSRLWYNRRCLMERPEPTAIGSGLERNSYGLSLVDRSAKTDIKNCCDRSEISFKAVQPGGRPTVSSTIVKLSQIPIWERSRRITIIMTRIQ